MVHILRQTTQVRNLKQHFKIVLILSSYLLLCLALRISKQNVL